MPDTVLTPNADGTYPCGNSMTGDEILSLAENIIEQRYFKKGPTLNAPIDTKQYLTHKLSSKKREVFAVIFMDVRNNVIAYEEMFQGALAEARVYPREVAKRSLEMNARSIIIAHNHPSGDPELSSSDKAITNKLVNALQTVEIRILDHIVVGGGKTVSFAEAGLILRQRDLERQIMECAKDNPTEVFNYLQTLPSGWDKESNRETDLLVEIRRKVLRGLSKESTCISMSNQAN